MKPLWKVKRLSGSLAEHAPAWDALNHRLFDSHPMLDSRYVNGLLKDFGNGTEYLCVLEANGDPCAMCVLRPRGLGIWTSFLPSQAQIAPTLVQNPDALQALMHDLPGIVLRLDMLCNDPLFGDLSTVCMGHCSSFSHALTMNIDLSTSFEDYWSQRSKKLVQNIGRYRRRLADDGLVCTMSCTSTLGEVGAAVKRYAELESTGWKGRSGTAVEVGNRQGKFYIALLEEYAKKGSAAVYELWFGDRLVASRLVIFSSKMVVMLKTTYDESMEKYAPGRLLLQDVIQHLFGHHPGKVIEFYTKANRDQLSWATGQRWIQHVTYDRTQATARAYAVLHKVHEAWSFEHVSETNGEDSRRVEIYRNTDEFPTDVRLFFETEGEKNIESSLGWYTNLVSTVFSKHPGVQFFILRKQGKPIAAMPVLISKSLFAHSVSSLGNYYTSIYSPLIHGELFLDDMASLLRAIRDACPSLGTLKFAPMDIHASSYQLLQDALEAIGLKTFRYFCFGNWTLHRDGNWSSYLKERTGTLRSSIKRMTKKLQNDGGSLELVREKNDLNHALAAYQRVYAMSWKKPEPYPQFVPGLAHICAEHGWLRMGIARLNGTPIAVQFWIVANGKANIFKVAYDEAYKAYAPGTVLMAMLMESVMEMDHVKEVDFLIGDDPYKKTWMSHRQERWGLVAYNPRNVAGFIGLCREASGRSFRHLSAWIRSLFLPA